MLTKMLGGGAFVLGVILVWASPARANCAMPSGYAIDVQGSTVRVELMNFQGRVCPDSSGLLRQEVSTGQVVKLAAFCEATDGGPSTMYVDECVPPGTYHYGLAAPTSASRARAERPPMAPPP